MPRLDGELEMTLLEWIEATALAEWARVSIEGYPIIITAHSIGLAAMVGPILILDIRLLGGFRGIPYSTFLRLFRIVWAGFAINALSGVVLFTMEATSYVSDIPFLIKFALVMVGAATAFVQHRMLSRHAASWQQTESRRAPAVVAAISIACWMGAIVAGRLIAYLD